MDRILDLLTLAIVLVFFVSSLALDAEIRWLRGLTLPVFMLAALSVLLPLAYWNSYVLHNEPTGIRDMFELLRFPMTLAMICFLAQIKVTRHNLKHFVMRAYIIPFWIVAFLCVAEITRLPVIADAKLFLWAQSKNALSFSAKYFRMSGTLENPNWFSLYLNMTLILFLFFFRKSLVTVGGILACVCLIVLTGSRTGMVGLLFLVASYFVITCLGMRRHPQRALVHLIALVAFVCASSYVVCRMDDVRLMKSVRTIGTEGFLGIESANLRASAVRKLTSEYATDPRLLGFGPSKYLVGDVIDNQYVDYLVRYGVIGLFLLMLSYGYYCLSAISLRKTSKDRVVKDYALCVFLLTCLLLLYFMTGEFGDTLRLSILYFGLITPVFVLSEEQARVAINNGRATRSAPNISSG